MGKPIAHRATRQNKVYTTSKVSGSGIDLYLPMSVHTRSFRMKLSGGIKQDGLLAAFVSFTIDLATNDELVEDTTIWCADVFLAGQPGLLDVLGRRSRVDQASGDIEVADQDHSLAHLVEFTYTAVQGSKEGIPKVISETIGVGRTIDSKENESTELETHTPAFGIQKKRVDAELCQFHFRKVATDLL
jgi:hypothetical protein